MKKTFFVLCLRLLAIDVALGQQLVSVPVMYIPISADANGMGSIAASLPSDNATATLANPAQVGLFGLTGILNASTYVSKTPWNSGTPISLNASAANVGINVGKLFNTPVKCGLGAGYSRVFFDEGIVTFMTFNNGRVDTIGSSPDWEKQENYTIGVGVAWIVKLALGYSFKTVNLEQAAVDSSGVRSVATRVNAHDYGIMVQIPIVEIISCLADKQIMVAQKLQPTFDINLGYSRRNIGGYISLPNFLPELPLVPLPRTADLGLNLDIGLRTTVKGKVWNLLSFIWAREAEDELVNVQAIPAPAGGYNFQANYESGLGGILPFDNLILGKNSGRVDLRKGWQVGVTEFFFIRGGSFRQFVSDYYTFGTSFKLDGLLKLLGAIDVVDIKDGPFAFLVDHFDLQYHYSKYTDGEYRGLNGTTFKEINLVIK